MSSDVQLLAILTGILTIVAAAILAFRQGTLTWQHVVVFSLGGVLAGISGVQLTGSTDAWSVTIGKNVSQLATATAQASDATSQQAQALAQLNERVDQLAETTQALSSAQGKPPAEVQAQTAKFHANSVEVVRLLTRSNALSLSAATTSKHISAVMAKPH